MAPMSIIWPPLHEESGLGYSGYTNGGSDATGAASA